MLTLSILIICLAHIVRVKRWELLIGTYEKPAGKKLVKALSLGYFINFFIPFKLGDAVRALYAGKSMKNGRGFSLATVIVERCIDVISVGIIFGSIYFFGRGKASLYSEITYYAVLGAIVFVALILLYIFRSFVKRVIGLLASLFNEIIEEKILRFMWALIWGFKDIVLKINRMSLIFETIIMWLLYILSYRVFAYALSMKTKDVSVLDVFVKLFSKNTLSSSGFSLSNETVYYLIFLLLPSVVLYSLVKASEWLNVDISGFVCSLFKIKINAYDREEKYKTNLIPQADVDERRNFLKLYFSGKDKEYIDDYLKINRNIMILRDFSAGSRATTILCTDGNENFYRKYAFSSDASKLSMQIRWIEEHKDSIKLPKIIRKEENETSCFYDMKYAVSGVTLFDYIHVNEKEKSWMLVEDVLRDFDSSIYRPSNINQTESDKLKSIEKYIDEKIIANLEKIMTSRALRDVVKYDELIINGTKYKNISAFKEYFQKDYLKEIFSVDPVSDIHGDLTAENIICTGDNDLYYIIDPNTGNIHNTKFIDIAKLLQSFHGGYEFYKRCTEAQVHENVINYSYIKSDVYAYMYEKLNEYLSNTYSRAELKSIYMHEIVNWLRLLPYQIDKGYGHLFYAGLITVLNMINTYYTQEDM